ncbi:hypothetical protein BH09CHL1_BH09CHL1_07030 [soil metagenome]
MHRDKQNDEAIICQTLCISRASLYQVPKD